MQYSTASVAFFFAAILSACGSSDTASGAPPVEPAPRQPVNTATARCEQVAGAPQPIETREAFVAATNGRWIFCSGHRSFDTGVVGFEIVGGEEYFALRTDFSGNVIRGAQPSDRGRVTVSAGASGFSLALDANGGPATLTTSPKRLTLVLSEGDAEYAASP